MFDGKKNEEKKRNGEQNEFSIEAFLFYAPGNRRPAGSEFFPGARLVGMVCQLLFANEFKTGFCFKANLALTI